jgi:hypothetical protein
MGHQPRAAMERLQRRCDRPPAAAHPADRRRLELRRGGQRRALRAGLAAALATAAASPPSATARATPCAAAARRRRHRPGAPGLAQRPVLRRQRSGAGVATRDDLLHAAPTWCAWAWPARCATSRCTTTRATRLRWSARLRRAAGRLRASPGEVVNYVENHDNQTLFDANAFKLPRHLARGPRPGADPGRRSMPSARASPTSTPAWRRCAASRWTATATTAATGSTGSTGPSRQPLRHRPAAGRRQRAQLADDAAAAGRPGDQAGAGRHRAGRATPSSTCCASAPAPRCCGCARLGGGLTRTTRRRPGRRVSAERRRSTSRADGPRRRRRAGLRARSRTGSHAPPGRPRVRPRRAPAGAG